MQVARLRSGVVSPVSGRGAHAKPLLAARQGRNSQRKRSREFMASKNARQGDYRKLRAHTGQNRVFSFADPVFWWFCRGTRMASGFSGPGSRQPIRSKPDSNRHVPRRTDSMQHVLSTLGSNAPHALPPTVSAQIDAHGGDPNFMTSLARGLAVIQAFSQRQRELTVSQISVKTGFSRAAVRRCLYTLGKLGFAASDDGRHFYLRPRVLALGHSYISSMPLAAMAQPILENVSHILHESCSIATLDRTEIIYIARANVTRIMSIDLGVGSRLPAFCTSMGRVLMAELSA